MQIASVAMVRGSATSREPSRIATVSGCPMERCRWMFSTATVASSTRMPVASASPPSVMRLIELPVTYRQITPANIAHGIEVITTIVLRQLPRNSRIMIDTSPDASTDSDATFLIAARTKVDWSKSSVMSMPSGAPARMSSSSARTPLTTSRLDASACLRMVR